MSSLKKQFCVIFRWSVIAFGIYCTWRIIVSRQNDERLRFRMFNVPENIKSRPENSKHRFLETQNTVSVDGRASSIAKSEFESVNCGENRYLIYTCHGDCNGLGDRQIGMISTYLLAELTGRRFVVDITHPCPLERAILPNHYNWLECRTFALRMTNNSTILLDYFERRIRAFSQKYSKVDIVSAWKDDIYRIKMNFYAIDFVRKYVIQHNVSHLTWIVGLSNEAVVSRVMTILFRPSKRIELEMETFLIGHSILTLNKTGRKLVGVHVRTGQNPTLPNDRDFRKFRGRPNVTAISTYLKRFNDSSKYVIFIATDSEEVRKDLQKLFKNIITLNRSIVHVDHVQKGETGCEGFVTAVLEQFLLSRCDILFLTKSNFGELAALQSHAAQEFALHIARKNTNVKATQTEIFKYYPIQHG